jgi:hypothetical protein
MSIVFVDSDVTRPYVYIQYVYTVHGLPSLLSREPAYAGTAPREGQQRERVGVHAAGRPAGKPGSKLLASGRRRAEYARRAGVAWQTRIACWLVAAVKTPGTYGRQLEN